MEVGTQYFYLLGWKFLTLVERGQGVEQFLGEVSLISALLHLYDKGGAAFSGTYNMHTKIGSQGSPILILCTAANRVQSALAEWSHQVVAEQEV